MVEVDQLCKSYGQHLALKNVSFELKSGDIVGFLGANGAGKSTSMNILAGYIAPTHGTVFIDGMDLLEEPLEVRKKIGYLPEHPPLYDDMLVDEYFSFVAKLKKVPQAQAEEEREKLYLALDLSDVRDRLIKNLSKGYRQRIGIAQAFCGAPPLIILDEPTAGLDPRQVLDFRRFISSKKGQHTFIISSHILSELETLCDHLLVINEGKVVANAPAKDILESMNQSEQLYLSVRTQEIQALLDELRLIEGVMECQIQPQNTSPGIVNIQLRMHQNQDPREAIFFKLAQHHWPILSMNKTLMNLEEIFLHLTKH
ncbi:MAG: ABC transporter ATP-binding protein [Spirochaetia bacterium]